MLKLIEFMTRYAYLIVGSLWVVSAMTKIGPTPSDRTLSIVVSMACAAVFFVLYALSVKNREHGSSFEIFTLEKSILRASLAAKSNMEKALLSEILANLRLTQDTDCWLSMATVAYRTALEPSSKDGPQDQSKIEEGDLIAFLEERIKCYEAKW